MLFLQSSSSFLHRLLLHSCTRHSCRIHVRIPGDSDYNNSGSLVALTFVTLTAPPLVRSTSHRRVPTMTGVVSGLTDYVNESLHSIRSVKGRQLVMQAVTLGMIVTSALVIWKGLLCLTGSESPVVVVLTGSMEPGVRRGDILFLQMGNAPIRAGEIVVFHIDGQDIPIVHRVIKVHQRSDTEEVDVLTKGDNNLDDDRVLYAQGQMWLNRQHVMGRVVGFLPYVGWATIIMTEKPFIKYVLIGAMGLLVITSKE